jgi:midasin (ATPase involved in ribosome maturation)
MKRDGAADPGRYVHILYAARFRRPEDRRRLRELYCRHFEPDYPLGSQEGLVRLQGPQVGLGRFELRRGRNSIAGEAERLALLNRQRPILETMAGCIHNNWPVILTGLASKSFFYHFLYGYRYFVKQKWKYRYYRYCVFS